MKNLDPKTRNALIRRGNQAFNEGNIELAAKIFRALNYKDGLIRIGDYYYYQKKQPLIAYGYYKKANHTPMLIKLMDAFVFAIKCWLWSDEEKEKKEG